MERRPQLDPERKRELDDKLNLLCRFIQLSLETLPGQRIDEVKAAFLEGLAETEGTGSGWCGTGFQEEGDFLIFWQIAWQEAHRRN